MVVPIMATPPPKSRGTLASLAAELGVSRTTVSNAYNNPDQLSPQLREKILAAAKRRGYPGPDPTARSLRTRRAGALGVILTEHMSYAFEDLASVEFLGGLAESSFGSENVLTLIPTGPEESGKVPMIHRAQVDGLVVYSVAQNDPSLQAALGTGLPVVICDQPYEVPNVPFVGIDDHHAIQPAVRALLEAGHRRIGILAKRLFRIRHDGFVTAEQLAQADLHVQRARVNGAVDMLIDASVPHVPIVTRHHNDHEAATDAARELLETHPDLTAVVCTTDSMAFGVLAYVQQKGIRIPEDLSVTGFDGVELAKARNLSTVSQPMRTKGEAAGRMLSELIEGASTTENVLLDTEFIPGATIAAAPDR